MYQAKRRSTILSVNIVLVALFICAAISIIPVIRSGNLPVKVAVFNGITVAIVFCVMTIVSRFIAVVVTEKIRKASLETKDTALISKFIEKMRFSYTLDDFYEIIGSVLEVEGDCSVLYVNTAQNYILYNSTNKLTMSKEVSETLNRNFGKDWKDGCFFIGANYGLVAKQKNSRGFFLVNNHHTLYVFCRYTKLFDSTIFKTLFEEYCRFQSRTSTIRDLTEISSLSKEWDQLAITQKSFLPPVMPIISKLSVAAYYRPLVNVSGDYYTVLPISDTKTLLMLGDVSGKGLAAALVMGLVMNTVKSLENKENLPAMIQAIDKAIKNMKLQDKYTVIFIGIVDTETMTIKYVNASMSDPLIITKSPTGYRIKPLTSNCSLVGIIDLPKIEPAEQHLFRGDVILMASDGVSEVMNEEGVELGDTELYKNTLKASAPKSPKEFVDDIVKLVETYNGGKKLRDDLTMMVAKVER
ncbi:MAG: SpoIIE family protein phosphatase [Treponema sp.]|nr:SpoIIE family protein phosphatase [Treponema sp.]